MQVQPPKHFTVDSQQYGDTVFLRLSGEFDLAAEEFFEQAVEELSQDARSIVVDLSALAFIDSSGLRALLRMWERSRSDGLDLAVVPGAAQVRHTMELTGMDRVLPVVTEGSAANGALAAPGVEERDRILHPARDHPPLPDHPGKPLEG
jgi:anti-sigma B factor antagonist